MRYKAESKTGEGENGGNHSSPSLEKKQPKYTINFQDIHNNHKKVARELGCKIESVGITGNHEQIEALMKKQNPLFQTKCNSPRSLNGAWNPLSRKLEAKLPKTQIGSILMSASPFRSGKTVSTGFTPVVYDSFDQLGEAMHYHAHSSAIYSPINRWDKYSNKMKWDFRRRLHNISYIGNILVYDFDNGTFTFQDAVDLLHSNTMNGLVIRSKSDPKYDYDRFKMLIRTDLFYPAYSKDESPIGFQKVAMGQYKDIYIGLATKYGFWKHADHSTIDPSRLIAQVNNADHERREYVAV